MKAATTENESECKKRKAEERKERIETESHKRSAMNLEEKVVVCRRPRCLFRAPYISTPHYLYTK